MHTKRRSNGCCPGLASSPTHTFGRRSPSSVTGIRGSDRTHAKFDNLKIQTERNGKSVTKKEIAWIRDYESTCNSYLLLFIARVLCLAYPFHPIGKPDQLRIAQLVEMRTADSYCAGNTRPLRH
jgi:hypothetical protein